MNEKDAIIICSMTVGLLAGIVAILIFLALRRRLDLWLRYIHLATPAGFLTFAASHWLGWFGLLVAIPAGGLIFFASGWIGETNFQDNMTIFLPHLPPESSAIDDLRSAIVVHVRIGVGFPHDRYAAFARL
jgi:hypothetical protein